MVSNDKLVKPDGFKQNLPDNLPVCSLALQEIYDFQVMVIQHDTSSTGTEEGTNFTYFTSIPVSAEVTSLKQGFYHSLEQTLQTF